MVRGPTNSSALVISDCLFRPGIISELPVLAEVAIASTTSDDCIPTTPETSGASCQRITRHNGQAVACAAAAPHCLIDKVPLRKDQKAQQHLAVFDIGQ